MNQLNDDVIIYLTQFLDYSIINLFLTCTIFTRFYQQFKEKLLKSAIAREISLIPESLIKFNEINLEIGHRVYSDRNLKINLVNYFEISAVEVNKYGRKVDDKVYCLRRNQYCNRLLTNDDTIVKVGISMGPFINSSDSRYCKYKYDINNVGFDNPEVNMLVIVQHDDFYHYNHEYYVSHFDGCNGTLKLVYNAAKFKYHNPKEALTFFRKDNMWIAEKDHKIVRFGGYLTL